MSSVIDIQDTNGWIKIRQESRKENLRRQRSFHNENISLEIVCSMDKIYSRLDIVKKT